MAWDEILCNNISKEFINIPMYGVGMKYLGTLSRTYTGLF